jgi:hypothetical protein
MRVFNKDVMDDLTTPPKKTGFAAMRPNAGKSSGNMMSTASAATPKKETRTAGYSGAKGDAGAPPAKGVKISAAKVSAPKAAPKAAKSAYKAKGVPDYKKDLGDYYLNATQHMFSSKAGGKKK